MKRSLQSGDFCNIAGIIAAAVSALLYIPVCLISRGLEAPAALQIINNASKIFMAGFVSES